MIVDVVMPAGGRINGEFALEAGAEVKALIQFGDKTILERMIDALRTSGRIRRIVVVGPGEIAVHPVAQKADIVLPEGGNSCPANIFKGLDWLYETDGGSHADRVLITTTDLPLITAEAINSYLNSCVADLDICMPVIKKEEFETRFPGLSLNYVKLCDGFWMIGCAFLINPAVLLRNRRMIENTFASRKSHILLARLLGPVFIMRYLLGRLTVPDVESRCNHLLGCTGTSIYGCAPELVLDIDRPVDYRYAKQYLAGSEVS